MLRGASMPESESFDRAVQSATLRAPDGAERAPDGTSRVDSSIAGTIGRAGGTEEWTPHRVALIAPPWLPVPPPAYGGTEAVLDGLARALAAAGTEVLLVTTGDSTCPVRRSWVLERAPGVGAGGTVTELRHVAHAYRAAADFGAEIVHDHTLVGPLVGATESLVPVVTTNHGPFGGELRDCYRLLGRRVPIVAISRHQAATAGEIPIAGVIHHGVDLGAYPPGDGTGGYALFLGRMNPDKGVHRAITVAREAGVPLIIAAKMREPAEQEYFEQAVRPLLGSGAEYIGEVGGREKVELLQKAVCLLNPIDWPEPFGMVMIEALATGTPVVATPCGAAPEIVDHGTTGFLVADDPGLAHALAAVADLDRSACRRAAEERFSLERMAADHLALYARVLAGFPSFDVPDAELVA